MSTQVRGFRGVFFGFASLVAMAGATGCASSGLREQGAVGVTMAQGPEGSSVRTGAVRVLETHVNPMVPVHLTAEGGEIAVRFGHSRTDGAVVHIDRDSLVPTGLESSIPAESWGLASMNPARAVLGTGRFIVCWKSGNAEQGYRVVAQAWTAGGDRLGAPVVISPADTD